MKKLAYIGSILIVFFLISFVIVSAQIKPTSIADYKYSATTTTATILTENELTILKENYNNNQEILVRLDKIILLLSRIERNTR